MTDYKTLSDAALVTLLKNSDNNAFMEIFYRYSSLLLLFTFRRLHDIDQSKGLIFEVFKEFWQKRERISIPEGLRPFLIALISKEINKKTR